MRISASGAVLRWKPMFAPGDQAFMWARMRSWSARSVVSRKRTPRWTPPLRQYLVVMAEMNSRFTGRSPTSPAMGRT
ncbi:Uncharacterised protein [Mycobacteroides abscessus subsp. abscessus]|nr:Uncharacterised protein [Mycobacteroides abscessus subsp. abscessus]